MFNVIPFAQTSITVGVSEILRLWDNTAPPIAGASTGQEVDYPDMATSHWVKCANGYQTWEADYINTAYPPNSPPTGNLNTTPAATSDAFIAPNGLTEAWTIAEGATNVCQHNLSISADDSRYLWQVTVQPKVAGTQFKVGNCGVNGVDTQSLTFDFDSETVVAGNANQWAVIKHTTGDYAGWWTFACEFQNNGSGTVFIDRVDACPSGYCAYWQRRVHILDNAYWYQVSQLQRLWDESATSETIQQRRNRVITCWGDSFVNSVIATNGADTWPSVVARSFGFVRNYDDSNGGAATGVGGETSTQIETRFLAMDEDMRNARMHIIWAGQNNKSSPTTIKADIADMVASLNHTEYLILGMTNTASDDSAQRAVNAQLNSDLSDLYVGQFIDVMPTLLANGDGSTQDNTDISNDTVPSSLRSDAVHLNAAGQELVGDLVVSTLNTLDWWDNLYDINPLVLREIPAGAIVREGYDVVQNLITPERGSHLTDTSGNGVPNNWYNFNGFVGSESKPSILNDGHTAIRHFNVNGGGDRPQTGPNNGTDYVVEVGEYYWIGFYIEEFVSLQTGSRVIGINGTMSYTVVAGNDRSFSGTGWYAVKVQITGAGWAGPRYGLGIDGNMTGDFTWSHPFYYKTTADSVAPPGYVPTGKGLGDFLPVRGDKGEFTGSGTRPSGWGAYSASNVTAEALTDGIYSFTTNAHLGGISTTSGFLVNEDASNPQEYTIRARRIGAQQSNETLRLYDGSTWILVLPESAADDEWVESTITTLGGNGGYVILSRFEGSSSVVTYEVEWVRAKSTAHESSLVSGLEYKNTYHNNSLNGSTGEVTLGTPTAIDTDQLGILLEAPNGNKAGLPLSPVSWTNWGGLSDSGYTEQGPDGSLSATKFTCDAGTSNHGRYMSLGSYVSGEKAVLYFVVKRDNHDYILLRGDRPSSAFATFNIDTLAVTETNNVDDTFIYPLANDFILVGISWEHNETGSDPSNGVLQVAPNATPGSAGSWDAAGTESVIVWGVKCEDSAVPTSFTTSTSPSSTTNVLVSTPPKLPSKGHVEIKLKAKYGKAALALLNGSNGCRFFKSNGVDNLVLYRNGPTGQWYSFNGTGAIGDINVIDWDADDLLRFGLRWDTAAGEWQQYWYNETQATSDVGAVQTNFTGWIDTENDLYVHEGADSWLWQSLTLIDGFTDWESV